MAKLTKGMIILDCGDCEEQVEVRTMQEAEAWAKRHCILKVCEITNIYGSQCYGWS